MYMHCKRDSWSSVCHYEQIDAAEMIEEEEVVEQKYVLLSLILLCVLFSCVLFSIVCTKMPHSLDIFLSFYRMLSEKVEMLKKRRLELKAANAAKRSKSSEIVAKESRQEESSSDDESEENFAVDLRAQHLWLENTLLVFYFYFFNSMSRI